MVSCIQSRINFQYRFFENDYPKEPLSTFAKSMEPTELSVKLLSALNKPLSDDEVIHIRELLRKGANPNACDSAGTRPIHLAIANSPSNTKLVLEIINFGADINATNDYGTSVLHFSLKKKAHKTTEILIKKGTNLNHRCTRGWTPLMIASKINDLWAVRILLKHGVDVNACDNRKRTALMLAVQGCFLEIIIELLDHGANPAMCNDEGMTALRFYLSARENLNLDVVNVLLLHCASFRGLEIDDQFSFMQIMRKCGVERKPPYHVCVKTLIKVYVLLTYPNHNFAQNRNLYDFAESCVSEIRYMSKYMLRYLLNVDCLLQRSLNGKMPVESELEALLPFVANNNYLIYSDMLQALFLKPFIRKKFLSLIMYVKKEGRNEKVVFLNPDLNSLIMSYLSPDDVLQFVLAAYLKTNSSGKFCSDPFLYPHRSCYNWEQIMDME